MLSRLTRASLFAKNQSKFMAIPQRSFRPGGLNPYKHNPTPISDQESKEQESKPVWDRVFDHTKYMQHEGPLKVSSSYFEKLITLSFSFPPELLSWTSSHSQE